jgi:hypothetical protein
VTIEVYTEGITYAIKEKWIKIKLWIREREKDLLGEN